MALMICLFGCATMNRPHVIARSDSHFPITAASKIALADRPQNDPQDEALNRSLLAALNQRGIRIVPQAEADFILTFQIEHNESVTWARQRNPSMIISGPYRTVVTEPLPLAEDKMERISYHSESLRLYLYPARRPGISGLTPAWEGYIEAGDQLRVKRATVLLRTLLDYFGKDFDGSSQLAQ